MDNEQLVYLHQQGDKKALGKLIEGNKGIVIKLANKYNGINREMELDDLIQEGTLGLITAANRYKFDMDHKAKFITYAVYYIDRYINTCVNGHSTKDINNNNFYKRCTSINSPVGNEDDAELGDLVECEYNDIECLEEKIYKEQLRKQLDNTMEEVTTLQERAVLKLHYGWNCKTSTLKEIGSIINKSTEVVRQIELRAFRKIRATSWGRKRIQEMYKGISIEKYRNVDACIRAMDYGIKLKSDT